jgi:hypothetical protein
MSISSVNGNLHGDFPVWESEDEKTFPVGMEEKISPKEV